MEIPPYLSTAPNKKPDFFEQYRWPILSALLVILAVGIYLIFVPPKASYSSDAQLAKAEDSSSGRIDPKAEVITAGDLVVDVAGGIKQPGVYHIAAGSITEDAITAAGGFSRAADMDAVAHQINRAEEIKDHSKIYIPKIGEATASIVYTNPSTSSSSPSTGTVPAGTKININSAAASDLEALPTIGPVLSQRIVDYRLENGPFATIEAIKDVNGISDAKFNQFKDLITI